MTGSKKHAPATGRDHTLRTGGGTERRLRRTPGLVLGPFYPVHLVDGHAGSARQPICKPAVHSHSRRLALSGCVLDTDARPLAGASIELWHADPQGRYQHPDQSGVEEIEPGFVGYEALTSQADGRWQIDTVVPGPYDREGVTRAPHLHFQVTYRNSRLVTQMFFPDHPLNAEDRWYGTASEPSLLVARELFGDPRRVALTWDIVMAHA
jgi:protocatechuate 3,4-dioxygenase beta subunit